MTPKVGANIGAITGILLTFYRELAVVMIINVSMIPGFSRLTTRFALNTLPSL
jgi:hypothetical protein